MTTATITPKRDWLNVGTAIAEKIGKDKIEAEIASLTWQPPGEVAIMPGMAINACIQQLNIPKVSAIAINGAITIPDGPESATYSILGIEGNYANGTAQLYVADTGTGITPLCADFTPSAA